MNPINRSQLMSLQRKQEILQMMEEGVHYRMIAQNYGIPQGSVYNIRRMQSGITECFDSAGPSTSKSVPRGESFTKKFERDLRQWYIRYRNKNITVTNEMIGTKARELNIKYRGTSSFQASMSWVSCFKKRYGLRTADTIEDLEVGNEDEANKCKAQLKNLLQSGEYTLDNVYNADCIGLMWRAVPENTVMYEASKKVGTPYGEKVTIFLGANATGSHKLPVLVIGTIVDPPCLKSPRVLSSIYKANDPPIMDSKLFDEWFDECFLESVRERQQKIGRRMKTLLLLDNVSTPHESGIVSTKDELVKIMYLSCDAAPLIQPMDHGIIACFKRMYGIELLETLTPCTIPYTTGRAIVDHYDLNMWDCCRMTSNAWSNVKKSILKNAWGKLLKDESEQSSEDPEIIRKDIDIAIKALEKIPGCEGCDSIAVMNWFESNKKHTDTQVDISSALIDFINAAMDAEANKPTAENFEDILDDSSSS